MGPSSLPQVGGWFSSQALSPVGEAGRWRSPGIKPSRGGWGASGSGSILQLALCMASCSPWPSVGAEQEGHLPPKGYIEATEGESRRVAQSGGLGQSWEDEPEKMGTEAGRPPWSWREMVRSGNDKPLLVIPAVSPGESCGRAGFVQGGLGHEPGG